MPQKKVSATINVTAVIDGQDGVSITSANVFYALSNQGPTGTPPADSAFTYDDFPNGNLQPGYYVWQATVVTFSNGNSEVTGKMCLGATTDFLQGTEVYATSQSGTNPPDDGTTNWKTTYTRQKGYYLWTATRVTYTNGTVAYLNKKCVGYWGEDGTSPWIADLSNEMDSVACDLSGKPTAAKSLTTTIALFYGQTAKSFGTPTVKRNGTAMTVNASSYASGVRVTYSNKVLTVAYNTSATISDVDEFEITITASDDPTVVRTLTFSVLGARPGATGEAATTYQLVPSASEIVRHKDGTYSPTSLTCYCTSLKAGVATDNPSAATMQYSYGSKWTDFTASTSFAASDIYAQTGKKLYLRLLVDGKVMDKESIPIVEDGPKGEAGYGLTLTPSQLIFEEKLGSDGQTVSIDYINNTVVAVVHKGSTPLTPTITTKNTSGTCSGCDLRYITISGGTVTMDSGSITLADGVSAGFFTVNIKADNGGYDRDVRINFYVNRLGTFTRTIRGGIETVKGEMTTYTNNKDSAVRHDYAVAIQTSAQGLTQKFTEQVSRAGADGRNLFGFSNDIVFDHATPFIQGYGLVGRPWLNTSDKTARIYNLGMYGRLDYYTVSCQVRTSSSSGYVRLQMNWHVATSGTQAVSGGTLGCVYATTDSWETLKATFLFDNAAEAHIGTSLQPGEAGSYSLGDINGYIDIGQVTSATDATRTAVSGNYIYIRHLKVEHRNFDTDWCESDEDIAYIGQGNLATSTPYDFSASGPAGNRQHQDTNTYGGVTVKDVYSLPYNNRASVYSDTWSQWLYYSLAPRQLKAGQIYTLSFWARSTVAGLKMMSTLRLSTVNTTPYNNNGSMVSPEADAIYTGSNGSIIESVRSRGDTKVLLTTDWRQYFVRYYVDTDCYLYELVAATIYAGDNLGKNCTVYIGDVQLQEGYVMSGNSFSSLIEQNARRISLVQQSGTKRAGIDIQNDTVNLFGDRVTFSNADGTVKDKVWIDPDKGTLHAVNGEFSGVVRATNFFHSVAISGSYTVGFCNNDFLNQYSDKPWIGNFTYGGYYTEKEANQLSGEQVGIGSMVKCTGAADIVVIKATRDKDTDSVTVTLPRAQDYEGKIVEIVDTRYTQPSSQYYVGSLYVRQCDNASCMKGDFTQSISISDQLTLNGNYEHHGGSYRLMSYKEGGNYYWVKLGTS